jgi:hypothetical protein
VLDILQKVFYRSNPAREAFVELCESNYVQKMTFDSYLYKTGGWRVPGAAGRVWQQPTLRRGLQRWSQLRHRSRSLRKAGR